MLALVVLSCLCSYLTKWTSVLCYCHIDWYDSKPCSMAVLVATTEQELHSARWFLCGYATAALLSGCVDGCSKAEEWNPTVIFPCSCELQNLHRIFLCWNLIFLPAFQHPPRLATNSNYSPQHYFSGLPPCFSCLRLVSLERDWLFNPNRARFKALNEPYALVLWVYAFTARRRSYRRDWWVVVNAKKSL